MKIAKRRFSILQARLLSGYAIGNVLVFGIFFYGIIQLLFPPLENGMDVSLLYFPLYVTFGLLLTAMQIGRMKRSVMILYTILLLSALSQIFRSLSGLPFSMTFGVNLFVGAATALMAIRGAVAPVTLRAICFIILAFFASKMLLGVDPSDIVSGGSRNIVSAFLIPSIMLLVILYKNGQIKAPVIPAATVLVLSVWSVGRSGIISSALIFIAMLFAAIPFNSSKLQRANWVSVVLSISTALSLLMILYLAVPTDDYLQHLSMQGFEDVRRAELTSDYLQRLTFATVLSGANFAEIPSIVALDLNPHNSFIMLHAYFGIFAIILLVGISLSIIKSFIMGEIAFATCALACCFRFFTDSIANSPFIFVLLFLFFDGGLWLMKGSLPLLGRTKAAKSPRC